MAGKKMTGRRSIAAVPCPACLHPFSRAMYGAYKEGAYTRRRVCQNETCGYGFMTHEVPATPYVKRREKREEVKAH
jgi:hypothetical protein